MKPIPLDKTSLQQKLHLSALISLLEFYVPNSSVHYLGDNEVKVVLDGERKRSYHLFSVQMYGKKVVKIVSINVPERFSLELMRALSHITKDPAPIFSTDREDPLYFPLKATGYLAKVPV